MKKIVLAFDAFKGCISANEACMAAAQGIHSAHPDATIVQIPLSDGGEGLVNCVREIMPSQSVSLEVHGPLMKKTRAEYAISADGQTAYMEMAAASGLTLVPLQARNPMKTTTYGVGEMLADAIRRGCKKIVMGIGGSATCDGGRGMMEALSTLGFLETDQQTGKAYRGLKTDCRIIAACDVNNPLFGKNGAAYVFAPQKGATPEQVKLLDEQLRCFARETEQAGIATPQLAEHPGAGAAGGMGYALLAYLKAELRSGIDIMLDLVNFDDTIKDADLVITGEGRSDEQTLMGKVPHGVLKRSKRARVPVWLISGATDDTSATLSQNFNMVKSINQHEKRPLHVLMQAEVAKENLKQTVKTEIESLFQCQ